MSDTLTKIVDDKACALAHGRMPPVGADDKRGRDGQLTGWRLCAQARETAVLLDQFRDIRLHPQIEGRIAPALLGQEIEKIPLRHQSNESALRGQMGKVADLHAGRSDDSAEVAQFSVRELEEFVQ